MRLALTFVMVIVAGIAMAFPTMQHRALLSKKTGAAPVVAAGLDFSKASNSMYLPLLPAGGV